ncbi:MAG: LacI family DNA-binding transcriptional regulator [Clostridia bacterium]|nr:LacI family DNA-binding transcriptional regulator [Clostridia bacterium]
MTLSKLAQLANVSVAVVSKAFSGREDVSDAMREHVFAVAREHGCFQQFYHARYDKPVIAVIIPEAISKYYIHYIETLKKDIEENGYTMLLSISNFDAQLTKELMRYYTEHSKVDGLVLVGNRPDFSFDCATSLISVISPKDLSAGSYVSYSLEQGMRICMERLYANGHRRIAYIGEGLTAGHENDLIREMERLDLDVKKEWIISSRFRFEEAGRDGIAKIMALPGEKPSVILGAYGYITQGILSGLSERGFSVPRDISVVSMDNDPFPLHPSLDVAHIPSGIDEMCAEAMRLLHERIKSREAHIPPAFVELKSTFHEGNTISPLL